MLEIVKYLQSMEKRLTASNKVNYKKLNESLLEKEIEREEEEEELDMAIEAAIGNKIGEDDDEDMGGVAFGASEW
jgi:hypothetical protein